MIWCKLKTLALHTEKKNGFAVKFFVVLIIFQEQNSLILAIIVERPNLTHWPSFLKESHSSTSQKESKLSVLDLQTKVVLTKKKKRLGLQVLNLILEICMPKTPLHGTTAISQHATPGSDSQMYDCLLLFSSLVSRVYGGTQGRGQAQSWNPRTALKWTVERASQWAGKQKTGRGCIAEREQQPWDRCSPKARFVITPLPECQNHLALQGL